MTPRRLGVAAGVAMLVFGSACSRRASSGAEPLPSAKAPGEASPLGVVPAEPSPSPAPAAPSVPSSSGPDTDVASPPAGEAHRSTVARLETDPLLSLHLAALREHFGAGAHGPFEVQRVDLAGGRTAVLVTRADESDPVVLGVDRDALLWSRPRPTFGIVPPVRRLALAARPDGGAVLFAWVASLHVVAARMWTDDGSAFGDFELFTPSACDALSAGYAPGLGWIAACTSAAGVRAQRLRENATVAWPREGVSLGAPSATGPAAIAFDSASTFMVLAQVAAVGGDRVLAYRYDDRAEPLWAAPVDLGAAARAAAPARPDVRVARDGVVRVALPQGLAANAANAPAPGKPARAAELRSSGEVRFSPP